MLLLLLASWFNMFKDNIAPCKSENEVYDSIFSVVFWQYFLYLKGCRQRVVQGKASLLNNCLDETSQA